MAVKATPASILTYRKALQKAMNATSDLYDLILDIQDCAPDTVDDLDHSLTQAKYRVMGLEDGLSWMLKQEL